MLNLTKSQGLNLTKEQPTMKKILIASSWDASDIASPCDVDITAFLLKHVDGKPKLISADNVIFFNNKISADQSVHLPKDNRTGEGDGDDEIITVDLSKVSTEIDQIAFIVTIFEAQSRNQTFAKVKNLKIRVDNMDSNLALCSYNPQEAFSNDISVHVGSLIRQGTNWEFKAIGQGFNADLNGIAGAYGLC